MLHLTLNLAAVKSPRASLLTVIQRNQDAADFFGKIEPSVGEPTQPPLTPNKYLMTCIQNNMATPSNILEFSIKVSCMLTISSLERMLRPCSIG